MRKTFAEIEVGDEIELRKKHDQEGPVLEVTGTSSSEYGLKIKAKNPAAKKNADFVVGMPLATSENVTEYYDEKNRYLWLVPQPEESGEGGES